MRIVWQALARSDPAEVRRFIERDDPGAAGRVAARIVALVERLAVAPAMGRPGRVPGTRELVVPGLPYVVPYRVVGDEVRILRVYHTSRRWPSRL